MGIIYIMIPRKSYYFNRNTKINKKKNYKICADFPIPI